MLSVTGQPVSAHSRRGPSPGTSQGTAPLRAGPVVVLTAIGLGAVAVIALWWSGTPNVSGFGDWITGAGRILGLLAGYGVVVLVALMARLPPLERGVGADRLARWHAMGGRYVVSLVVAHALLIIWGYAITAHEGVVSETGTLLTSYPDVLMATVAGFLLLGIGLVSARAARRRMSYETWYYLHFYTYLAIALAFSHQFADGASFISSLPARAVWSALYLTVAVLVVWYRVVSPLRSAARHRFRVVGIRRESAGRGVGLHRGSTWTSCRPSRGSSSAGGSWPGARGGPRIRIRCRRFPAPTSCGSRSRTAATTAAR